MREAVRNIVRKASLGLVDGILLALCAAAVTYLSSPVLVRMSMALGQTAEPNKGADIQAVSVFVFFGVLLAGICVVFCAAFAVGCLILVVVPGRVRRIARIGIMLVFVPVFIQTAKRGPRGYFYYLIDPSIRQNEAEQKVQRELQRKLQASTVLSVEWDPDGVKITNNSDQLVRVQVAFNKRLNNQIIRCFPGQSTSFPPSPSDEKMNLPAKENRRYLWIEARDNGGSQRSCGFDNYDVWGWDEKGTPVFLSERAYLH